MINFKKINFVKSAPTLLDRPHDNLPEIVFIGRSNVGKSSLINALTSRKNLAHTSSKPGFTKLLNYYDVDSKFYLVDAPGYGFTISGSKHLDSFSQMMETYFENEKLKGVVFLVDSRHELSSDDIDFYKFIEDKNIPFILIATKVDKLNQKEKAKMKKNISTEFGEIDFLPCSINDEKLVDNVRRKIVSLIE